jgi:phosphoglucomutase/phosphomannomutase
VLCIERYDQIATTSLDHPLIHLIDTEMDEAYVKAIRPLQQSPKQNALEGKSLKIIYSSLHGAGIALVPMALKDWGFNQIVLVTEQCTIDGSFPTVKSPNPENPDTLKLGIEQLEKSTGDLLLITDPDADRLGVVVTDKGCPILLNGNETASICTWYLAHKHKELHTLSGKHAVVTTIVSTQLMPAIAHAFGIQCIQVLTGFKYIGEKIHEWEESPNGLTFLFGAEESYGYLVGTHARDKDAVVACCLLAEIALYAKKNNQTLIDLLHQIYAEYGIFREIQHSIDFPAGKHGMDQIQAIMDTLRSSPIQSLMGTEVLTIEDYLTGYKTQVMGGNQKKLQLPTSDVLVYQLEDGSRIIIRPSGTEPKIKIYVGVRYPSAVNIEEGIIQAEGKLKSLLKAIKETILSKKQGSV